LSQEIIESDSEERCQGVEAGHPGTVLLVKVPLASLKE